MLSTLRHIIFPVLNITAIVFMSFAGVMLIPLAISLYYSDGAHEGFMIGIAASLITGIFLRVLTLRDRRELVPRDGFLLATLIWVMVPIFAALPLYFEIKGTSFTFAFFEAMSGTTTTCATVYSGLDSFPESINFWRCFLSWLGGMGILVLAVAILPLLGVGGAQLFNAESSGPLKETRLTPRIADTAKGLWWIYIVFSVLCTLGFYMAGMTPFDSVIHMFTTVSLGGFSSHDASFGYWNSIAVESVAIFFMLICGASFSLHFIAWKKGSIKTYFANPEFVCWISVCVLSVLCMAWLLQYHNYYPDFLTALRYSAFNVMSVISTSGFATTDYNLWPIAGPVTIVCIACFASCGGSAGGGVKMMRTIILAKGAMREFMITLHPRAVIPLTVSGMVVEPNLISRILAYMILWGVMSIVTSLALMVTGLDPVSAISATIACITNLGPGLGVVGPASNFGGLSDFQLWLCIVCMLVGRLELMTVFVLFTRAFWKI